MNFKRLALASLLTLACTTGQSANTDWGPHGILESALGLTSAGPITETFSFSLADTATLSSTLSLVGSFADAAYSLSSLGLDGLLGTADDVELARWSVTGTPTVNSLAMASGSYYYSLTATASGITAYAISSTATAPVPEAASWAYLALGLGAVALLARRHHRAPQGAGAPASVGRQSSCSGAASGSRTWRVPRHSLQPDEARLIATDLRARQSSCARFLARL